MTLWKLYIYYVITTTLPAYGHLFPLTILQRCILMLALRCVTVYYVLHNALSVNVHSRYFFKLVI